MVQCFLPPQQCFLQSYTNARLQVSTLTFVRAMTQLMYLKHDIALHHIWLDVALFFNVYLFTVACARRHKADHLGRIPTVERSINCTTPHVTHCMDLHLATTAHTCLASGFVSRTHGLSIDGSSFLFSGIQIV